MEKNKPRVKTTLNKDKLVKRLRTIEAYLMESKVISSKGEEVPREWTQENISHIRYIIREVEKLIAVV